MPTIGLRDLATAPRFAAPLLQRKDIEAITSLANDVGLLAEQFDSATGEQLGNFPQAFTHIGLVNAAAAIADAEQRASGRAASVSDSPNNA